MSVMSVLEEVHASDISEELSELLSWVSATLWWEFVELSGVGGDDILGLLLELLEDCW